MPEMKEQEWWRTIYDEHYLDIYGQVLTPEKSAQEVDFIEEAAVLEKGSKVLDLACGFGRHTNELSARGYQVTGVDLSKEMLALGVRDAKKRGVFPSYLQADMRQPLFGKFDVALLMASSFGYFSDQENQRVLHNIARVLGPDGKLLLDNLNFEYELNEFQKNGSQISDHQYEISDDTKLGDRPLRQHSTLDARKQITLTRIAWFQNGVSRHIDFVVKLYTLEQLVAMLSDAEMKVIQTWGDYELSSYSASSPRLTILSASPQTIAKRVSSSFHRYGG